MQFQIKVVSETNLIIYFGDQIDSALAVEIGAISQALRCDFVPKLIEVIPSYTSILVEFNPLIINHQQLIDKLRLSIKAYKHSQATKVKTIELPTYYSIEVGPDLTNIAKITGFSVEKIIQLHSQMSYRVCAIGFAPGFAFLAKVDDRIAVKRHSQPRQFIPAGSVGIANQQTAVYPNDSPAGWQIIGNCPLPLYTPEQEPITPFSVGDEVNFKPIDKDEFLALGGSLCSQWQ